MPVSMQHASHLQLLDSKADVSESCHASADDTNLQFSIRSTDGGEFSSEYSCENVLREDSSCYCSVSPENVNLVMEYSGKSPYVLTSIVVAAPSRGFTAPVGQGLVFCTWEKPSAEFLRATRKWDGVTSQEEYNRLKRRLASQGAGHEEQDPVAFFDISKSTRENFAMDVPRSGRYVVVKLVRSQQADSANIDVQYIGFRGWDRPQAFTSGSYC